MAKAKKEESTEIVSWKEALAADAKQIAHNEGTDSSAITIQHGTMMYHEQPVPDNQLDVIILAATAENCLYTGPYDPDNISSPDCFAQALDFRDLAPHENVPEPRAASCEDCEFNKFGSAEVGKGKACKNYRKLIFIPADTGADDVPKAELAYMKVSPTSVKNWRKYAQALVATQGIPYWAAKTRIKVVPDKKTIHQVLFEGLEPIADEELLAALHGRIDAAEEKLLTPYTYEEDGDENSKF